MNLVFKLITLSAAVIAMITGCGETGDNIPSVKLTASAIISDLSIGHGHNVEMPFSGIDLASNPGFTATAPFQYRSSDNTGHSHVIALSKLQMIDLNNGLRVTLTSSTPDTSISHTHVWNLQGGGMLYDKHCYNCHTNDKRGQNPMNVVFNAGQTSAVKNPAAQPLSTSPAATPDPTFIPVIELSLDGVFLYGTYCAGCHGPLADSTKSNRTAAQIKLGMGTLGLSDAQLKAIETALIQ